MLLAIAIVRTAPIKLFAVIVISANPYQLRERVLCYVTIAVSHPLARND